MADKPRSVLPTVEANSAATPWQVLRGVFQGAPPEPAKPADTSGTDDKPAEKPKLDGEGIQRLLELAKTEQKALGIALASVAGTSAISLALPAAVGHVLDSALAEAGATSPAMLAAGLTVLFGTQTALIILRSALLTIAGERISAKLRSQVLARMLALPTAWFDAQGTGKLVSSLSNDIAKIQSSLTSQILAGAKSGVMVVASTAALFWLSPALASLACVLVPPTIGAAVFFGRYVKRVQAQVQSALANTVDIAQEVLSSVRVVKQLTAERRILGLYDAGVQRAYEHARAVGIASAWFDGTVHLAANMAIIAVLTYGGSQVVAGDISAGELTSFLMYSLYAALHAGNLSTVYTELSKGAGASKRVFEVLGTDPEHSQGLDAVEALRSGVAAHVGSPHAAHESLLAAAPDASIALRLEDVSFKYPAATHGQATLHNVNLDIPALASTVLVGESGCGKSTVAHLVSRLYPPTIGRVLANGIDLQDISLDSWRAQLGVVSQEPPLFGLAGSIRENIRLAAPHASDEAVQAAADVSGVSAFAASLPDGLDTKIVDARHGLSGGQKQRVAIARMVLRNPALVINDEFSSALDASSEAQIHHQLADFFARRTVLGIAHRLSTIQTAQHVAVLQAGELVQAGPMEQCLHQPGPFHDLVSRQLITRK